jgi:hypothetical protein
MPTNNAKQAGIKQQHRGEVIHSVAHRLEGLREWLGKPATSSRDFHAPVGRDQADGVSPRHGNAVNTCRIA